MRVLHYTLSAVSYMQAKQRAKGYMFMGLALCADPCAVFAGGGDSEEELDISLLRITLFHEHWQGLLHELDLATLRSNSAIALKTPTTKSDSSGSIASVAVPTEQPASVHPSSSGALHPSSSSASPAQNLTQPAASSSSSTEEEEQGDMATSSKQVAGVAGMHTAEELQEPAMQASASRQGSAAFQCMIADNPETLIQHYMVSRLLCFFILQCL